MIRLPTLLLAAAVPIAVSCALVPRSGYEVPAGPRDLDAATPDERRAYLRRAQVWEPVEVEAMDLLAGPQGPGAFTFRQDVTCDYVPGKRGSGLTPKFDCALTPDDVVKVKYGAANGEVFAETAGTRLFWALGFGTDRQYPVRVTCRHCPEDPWNDQHAEPGASRVFDPAIIERDAPGTPIEVRGMVKGWAWWELAEVQEDAGGAPRAHLDALRLLAAFVQHADNKDQQQELVCLPGGVEKTAEGHETCGRPFLRTVDLGASFSRGDLRNTNKFELSHWSEVPVWKDRAACVAKLKRSPTGTLGDPKISEAGRAFLAAQLSRLSERQIRDLFVAARAEQTGERDQGRSTSVDGWVNAFLSRRAEIVDHRCPGSTRAQGSR